MCTIYINLYVHEYICRYLYLFMDDILPCGSSRSDDEEDEAVHDDVDDHRVMKMIIVVR